MSDLEITPLSAQKSLSVVNAIEKSRLHSDSPWLICLEVAVIDQNTLNHVETLRLVRNDEDVTYRGYTYIAFNFDLKAKYEAGAQPTVTLTVNDITKAIQARMQAYGGGVGFKVAVFAINAGDLTQPPEALEHFDVLSATASNYTVTWELGVENFLSLRFPQRVQLRDRCVWRYKSHECGYTGSNPTCDLTLNGPNGCRAHNNVRNFGGFPGIQPRQM